MRPGKHKGTHLALEEAIKRNALLEEKGSSLPKTICRIWLGSKLVHFRPKLRLLFSISTKCYFSPKVKAFILYFCKRWKGRNNGNNKYLPELVYFDRGSVGEAVRESKGMLFAGFRPENIPLVIDEIIPVIGGKIVRDDECCGSIRPGQSWICKDGLILEMLTGVERKETVWPWIARAFESSKKGFMWPCANHGNNRKWSFFMALWLSIINLEVVSPPKNVGRAEIAEIMCIDAHSRGSWIDIEMPGS